MIGSGVLADSLAQNLTSQGLALERASVNRARTTPASPPSFIVLAGDAARDRGAAVLAQRAQASDDSTPVVVICAAQPSGALPQQPSSRHVAYLTPEGGVKECARRLRALFEAFAREGLAKRSLEQLLSEAERALEAAAPAAPPASTTASAPEPSAAAPNAGPAKPNAARPIGAPSTGQARPAGSQSAAPSPQGGAAKEETAKLAFAAASRVLASVQPTRPLGNPSKRPAASAAKAEPAATGAAAKRDPAGAKPLASASPSRTAFGAVASPAEQAVAKGQPGVGAAQAGVQAAKPWPTPALASAAAVPQPNPATSEAARAAPDHEGTQPLPSGTKPWPAPTQTSGEAANPPPTAAGAWPASKQAKAAFGTLAQADARAQATPSLQPSAAKAGLATPHVAGAFGRLAQPAANETRPLRPKPERSQAPAALTAKDAATGKPQLQAKSDLEDDRPTGPVTPPAAKAAAPPKQPQAKRVVEDERPTISPVAPTATAAGSGKAQARAKSDLDDDRPTGPAAPRAAKAATPSPKDRSAGEEELTTLYGSELQIEIAAASSQHGAGVHEEVTVAAPQLPQPPSPPRSVTVSGKGAAPAGGPTAAAPRVTRQAEATVQRSPTLATNTAAAPRGDTPSQRPRRLASPLEPVSLPPQPFATPETSASLAPRGETPSRRPRRLASPLDPVSLPPEAFITPDTSSSLAPQGDTPSRRPRRLASPLEPVSLAPQRSTGAAAVGGGPGVPRRPASPLEPVVSHAPALPAPDAIANSNAASGALGAPPRRRAGDPLRAPAAWPQAVDLSPGLPTISTKRKTARGRSALIACTLAALGGSAYLLRNLYDDSPKPVDSHGAAGALEQIQLAPAAPSPTPTAPDPDRSAAMPVSPSDSTLAKPSVQADRPTGGRSTGPSRAAEPETDQGRAQALVKEGLELARRGRIGLAEGLYLKALQLVPEYPNAMAELVRVHLARRDGAEAVRWAERLVRAQPNDAVHQLLLGDAQALRGDGDAARAAWTKAARSGNAAARKRLEEE